MLLTGRRIPAREAAELGLINEVVPRAGLDEAVQRWVDALLACAPLSQQAIKQVVRKTGTLSPADAQALRLPALVAACNPRTRTKACSRSSRSANHNGGKIMTYVIASGCIDVRTAPASNAAPSTASTRAGARCTSIRTSASAAASACPSVRPKRSTTPRSCRLTKPCSRRSTGSSSTGRKRLGSPGGADGVQPSACDHPMVAAYPARG